MAFNDYIQGLENISIKVTPLSLRPGSAHNLADILSPNLEMLEPTAEKKELKESDYPNCIKRILYSATIRNRQLRLATIY